MKKPSRAVRFLQNVCLAIGATIVTLAMVETGFRIYACHMVKEVKAKPNPPFIVVAAPAHVPSADPNLTYEYRPNHSVPGDPDFSNSVGMRGPERSKAKPPNTVRIAGIGDSMLAGDSHPYGKTFLFVLEDMLNDAATSPVRFEVLNFGVSGYNSQEQAVVLHKKTLAYDPDWVILGIVINDCQPSVYFRVCDENGNAKLLSREHMERTVPFSAGLRPDHRAWWSRSVLLRWIHYRTYVKVDHRKGVLRFWNAFGEMAGICHDNGIRMLVVILTEDVEVSQKENPRKLWHDLIRDAAAEFNVPVLDMYELILEHLKQKGLRSYSHYWMAPDDLHPTAEGHRLFAEILFRKLASMGILDMKPE